MAGRKRKQNKYEIIDNYVIIYLDRRDKTTLETLIDKEDFDKVLNYKYKWYSKYNINTDSFYVYSKRYKYNDKGELFQTTYKLNKYVLDYEGDKEIDHKNHNTLDNRKVNLRVSEYEENSKHRRSRNKNNKSGYRNVSWANSSEEWLVQLQINKKNKVLGRFPKDQLEEAGKFAEEMRKLYYGEYAGNN